MCVTSTAKTLIQLLVSPADAATVAELLLPFKSNAKQIKQCNLSANTTVVFVLPDFSVAYLFTRTSSRTHSYHVHVYVVRCGWKRWLLMLVIRRWWWNGIRRRKCSESRKFLASTVTQQQRQQWHTLKKKALQTVVPLMRLMMKNSTLFLQSVCLWPMPCHNMFS